VSNNEIFDGLTRGKNRVHISKVRALTIAALLLICGRAFGQSITAASIREADATTSDGVRIHYLESGDATSSRVLVLIPGWLLPAYLWKEQLQKFSQSVRVVAIDPRSQGESTKTPDGNSPEVRAKDLRDVLVQLRVSRCVLVGWSQGAQDIAAYVQQFGTDSVAGVVFVEGPIAAGPAELEVHRDYSRSVLLYMSAYTNQPKGFTSGMVHSIFEQPHPDLNLDQVVNSSLRTPTATGIAMLEADIFGADRRPALAKLNRPALIVAASDSPELDQQKQTAAAIPGSIFLVIEKAGYAVFVDQPKKFDDALQNFLQTKAQW
jgi:non-heme chloroperoxidase